MRPRQANSTAAAGPISLASPMPLAPQPPTRATSGHPQTRHPSRPLRHSLWRPPSRNTAMHLSFLHHNPSCQTACQQECLCLAKLVDAAHNFDVFLVWGGVRPPFPGPRQCPPDHQPVWGGWPAGCVFFVVAAIPCQDNINCRVSEQERRWPSSSRCCSWMLAPWVAGPREVMREPDGWRREEARS